MIKYSFPTKRPIKIWNLPRDFNQSFDHWENCQLPVILQFWGFKNKITICTNVGRDKINVVDVSLKTRFKDELFIPSLKSYMNRFYNYFLISLTMHDTVMIFILVCIQTFYFLVLNCNFFINYATICIWLLVCSFHFCTYLFSSFPKLWVKL